MMLRSDLCSFRIQKFVKQILVGTLILMLLLPLLPVPGVKAAAGDTIDAGQTGIVMDSQQSSGVTRTGTASAVTWAQAYNGSFLYANMNTTTPLTVTFTPQIPQDGYYEFYVRTPGSKYYVGNVPYTLNYEGGAAVLNMVPSADGQTETWKKLGTSSYAFKAGGNYSIVAGGSGYATFPGTSGAGTCVDAIKLVKVKDLPNEADIAAVDQELAKYETHAVIKAGTSAGSDVLAQVLVLRDGQSANPEVSIKPAAPVDGTYLKVLDQQLLLKQQNNSGVDASENAVVSVSKGNETRTLNISVTIETQPEAADQLLLAGEVAKYETVATVSKETIAGSSIFSQVVRLKEGATADSAVQMSVTGPQAGNFIRATGTDLILTAVNDTVASVTENVEVSFMKGSSVRKLNIMAAIAPQRTASTDVSGDFTKSTTWYHEFAPGIINPNDGTIEMTLRIDKPLEEFGNNWDFIFTMIPAQTISTATNLISAHIPPVPTGTKGPLATYVQPLTFFVRNGETFVGADNVTRSVSSEAKAKPEMLNYQIGVPFNLAFQWKTGEGGFTAIYKDGVEIARTNYGINPVPEQVMPYEFIVERGNPYNVSNLKISTKAINSTELEKSTSGFTRGADTALLADTTYGRDVAAQKFVTPWHISSGYSVVKPAFRSEKQIFFSGETAVLPVMTVNYSAAPKQYDVTVQAKDPYGHIAFTETHQVVVPADATYRVEELPLTGLNHQVGLWYLETTVSSLATGAFHYSSAVSKVRENDTAVPDGRFADYYGQHIPYAYDKSVWTKINTSATRTWEAATVFMWNKIEPTEGHFVWDKTDDYVDASVQSGIDVLAVMGYPSKWASAIIDPSLVPAEGYGSNPYPLRPERWVSKDIVSAGNVPGDGHAWANYMYQTMKRYAGKVRYYEIVNEVNFHPPYLHGSFSGTKEEYFQMLKLAYEQAQRVKQEYKAETGRTLELNIVSSGFTSVEGTMVGDRQMVLDALSEPNAGYFDIFNIHGYNGISGISSILTAYQQARVLHPNLKLWQGEVYPAEDPVLSSRLYKIVENYTMFMSVGTSKYFNMGTPTENTFLTIATQSPTEVFQTVATLQNQVRKVDQYIGRYSGFTNENLLTVNHYMRRTDGNYLSIFSTNNSEVNVFISNADQIISVEDNFGNALPVTSTDAGGMISKKSTVFIVSKVPLVLSKVSTDGAPMLSNGGFEKTTGDPMGGPSAVTADGWSMGADAGAYGTQAYLSGDKYTGVRAMAFDSSALASQRTYVYQTLQVSEPGVYALSGHIKKAGGGAVVPELSVTSDGKEMQVQADAPEDQYGFIHQSVQIQNPGTVTVRVGIRSGAGQLLFDDIAFERIPDNVTLAMDNEDSGSVVVSGAWTRITRENSGSYHASFLYSTAKDGKSSVTYTPELMRGGMYDIYVWNPNSVGTSSAPYAIQHAEGTTVVPVDQTVNRAQWFKIGSFPFAEGHSGSVRISNSFTTGNLILADGVKFVRTGIYPLVRSIEVSAPAVTVKQGESIAMKAVVMPENAENKAVTWSVENISGSAEIDAVSGVLAGISKGNVRVIATAADGSGIWGSADIEVTGIPVTSVVITTGAAVVVKGTAVQMTATLLPENAGDKSVVWSVTQGTGEAVIDPASGILTGVSAGSVKVRATAGDGSGAEGVLDIEVIPVLVRSIAVTASENTLKEADDMRMDASVFPENAENKKVTWSVINGTGQALIDPSTGVLSAVAAGHVTVVATAEDSSGVTGTYELDITRSVPGTIQRLIVKVKAMDLPEGIRNSIVTMLQHVLESWKEHNEKAALNQLSALVHEVTAQTGKKLTLQQATELIKEIRELLSGR